jgi:hypothetical protein
LEAGAVDATRLAEGDEGHVGQQQARCIHIIGDAKVAALGGSESSALLRSPPQLLCQLHPGFPTPNPLETRPSFAPLESAKREGYALRGAPNSEMWKEMTLTKFEAAAVSRNWRRGGRMAR